MYKRILYAVIVLLISLTATAQNKEERKIIRDQIEVNHKLLEEYFKKSNADSLAGMFSPNCHFIMEYQEMVESREDVLSYFKEDFGSGKKVSGFTLDSDEIKIYDDIVLEMGLQTIEYTQLPDKKLHISKYNYMFVWKKSKSDRYRLRAAMWNSAKNPCK